MAKDPDVVAEQAVDAAVSAARRVQHDAESTLKGINDAVVKSATDQPLTTLAIAAAIGFALGAILKV